MVQPVPTKAFVWSAKAAAMCTAPHAETRPPPPIPPFLLAQTLSLKKGFRQLITCSQSCMTSTLVITISYGDVFSHMHTPVHTLQHKGSLNDVQAKLHQFHLEVQEGRGAIPIDLETPTSLRKRYKANHRGAYVHQAGGGSTLSDVEAVSS